MSHVNLSAKLGFVLLGLSGLGLTTPAWAAPCAGFEIEGSPYSFGPMNAAPSVVGGVQMPRVSTLFYRGIPLESPQFGVEKVTAAILGISSRPIATYAHYYLTELLLRTNPLPALTGPTRPVVENLRSEIATLEACAKNQPFTRLEANHYASELLDRHFRKIEASGKIPDFFFDFRGLGGAYRDSGAETLFASVYQPVTDYYGAQTLIFKDPDHRAIDLNYWNYKTHGTWRHASIDLGEVVMPGYVDSKDVMGLLVKGGRAESTGSHFTRAMTRFDWQGQHYVLILDPQDSNCIDASNPNGRPVFCESNYSIYEDALAFPKPLTARPVPVIGVVSSCPKGTDCPLPEELKKLFRVSQITIDPAQLIQIKRARNKNHYAVYEPLFTKSVQAANKNRLIIVEATYGGNVRGIEAGNVTAQAAAFCDGRSRCEYKVAQGFLGETCRHASHATRPIRRGDRFQTPHADSESIA